MLVLIQLSGRDVDIIRSWYLQAKTNDTDTPEEADLIGRITALGQFSEPKRGV